MGTYRCKACHQPIGLTEFQMNDGHCSGCWFGGLDDDVIGFEEDMDSDG